MKFACECGNVIHDQTDYLSHAAHLIADQDLYDATAMSERGSADWWPSLTRKMYQCHSCGRLWIENHQRELQCFVPEEHAPHFLSSIHGNRWKRLLRGWWEDKSVISNTPHGVLTWGHLSDEDHATFKDWQSLERAYHDRFAELKKQGILRDALLKKNGETIHSWEA